MIQLITVVNEKQYEFDNIGTSRIAAFLSSRDINVKTTFIYQENSLKEIDKIDFSYDIFGFSAYNTNIDFIFALAKIIKQKNSKKLIFLGSKYATDAADLILDESKDIDFIILGHGEYPLLEFFTLYKNGKSLDEIYKLIPNIKTRDYSFNKEECVSDINTLVWPERTNTYLRNNFTANICTSHGCAGNCSFCSVSEKNHKWSGRPAKDIFDEIIFI